MRMSLKVIGILWIGLFLIIGGLLYNAYSKFKPETFIALLTEQVQKNFPEAKLHVGKVSYGFSLDFTLNLQNIHLRRSGKLLGSIDEVELKVPWWLLLSNRGNAQVNLTKLDIYIDHADSHELKQKITGTSPGAETIKVSLPTYLADAMFTLRAKEISIRDIHNARRYFMISKLLVREFQYGKNSAFELNIPISIKHKEVQYNSELWLFGDVTPETIEWKLNYRGEFRTRETNDKFQIEDLVINGHSKFMPAALSVQSELNFLVEKETIGKGELRAGQDDLTVNMQFTKLPLNYFTFIYEDIKNPYLKVLDGTAAGSVKFAKQFDDSVASVQGKLSFEGNLTLSDTFSIPGKWQIGFQDSRWDTSFLNPKGEASFFRRSSMDMKKNNVIQFTDELGFANMDVAPVMQAIAPLAQFTGELPNVYYTSAVSFNKCKSGEKSFEGKFRYGHSPDLKFYQAEIKLDAQTALTLDFVDKHQNKSLEGNFKKFTLTPAFQFLAPFLTATEAVLTGKVQGQWTDNWDSGLWKVEMNGEQLNQLHGTIPDLISKTSSFFQLDSSLSKQVSLNLAGKNNILTINSLMLDIPESAKITGSLSSKQKSVLTLTYPKDKKVKALKKEVLEPYWMQKETL